MCSTLQQDQILKPGNAPFAVKRRWLQLRQAVLEREGSEWLILGRPDTRIDWMLQAYKQYQKVQFLLHHEPLHGVALAKLILLYVRAVHVFDLFVPKAQLEWTAGTWCSMLHHKHQLRVCASLQGTPPSTMPAFDNKENLGNLDLSEHQVMQKAQAQLQLEGGGLKELPVDHHAENTPLTPQPVSQAAANEPPATNTASTGHLKAGHTPGNSFPRDPDANVAIGPTAMLDGESSMSFEIPDRAMSTELANAEEPVPWHKDQQPARNLDSIPHDQASDNGPGTSDIPHPAESYPKVFADNPTGACDGQSISRLPRKQQPNRFLQCISCGAVQAS